jgi:hypothetical protein
MRPFMIWYGKTCGTSRAATGDNIVRTLRIAYWLNKATHTYTHRIRNTYCLCTVAMVRRTRLNVTFIHMLYDINL